MLVNDNFGTRTYQLLFRGESARRMLTLHISTMKEICTVDLLQFAKIAYFALLLRELYEIYSTSTVNCVPVSTGLSPPGSIESPFYNGLFSVDTQAWTVSTAYSSMHYGLTSFYGHMLRPKIVKLVHIDFWRRL